MELPIAKQSYLPTAESLVRAIQRADVIQNRTAAEETQLEGAVAFTNARRPSIRMINRAIDMAIPDGSTAEAVLDEVFAHYRAAGVTCHNLHIAGAEWPASLAQAAEKAGYTRASSSLYLLDQFRRPASLRDDLQVIPGRAAYAELRRLHRRCAVVDWNADDRTADDLADTHIDFYDEPRIECFLGRLAGQPVGIVNVLTLGNIGVITDVAVDPDHRRRGIGRTLMSHAMDFCHRAQFERVVLEISVDNAPAAALYEAMGFKRMTTFDAYRLKANG